MAVRQGSRLTLVAMSLGFAVVQLDVSVVNVAIRPIGDALGGGVAGLQWIVSAYTITFAAFILSAGAVGDRIGARAVQGVGAAVLVPCSLILLNHAYREPHERARAVGFWAAGASVALSAGPLVGGALIATLGWRAIFFINVPVGLVGIRLALRHARETPPAPGHRVDLPG